MRVLNIALFSAELSGVNTRLAKRGIFMTSRLALLIGFCLCSGLFAESDFIKVRGGHFFPPPRDTFFFRPDLYVYRVGQPYYHASYRRLFSPVRYGYSRSLPVGRVPTYSIYRIVVSPPPTGGIVRVNSSDIIFNVDPPRALVFVDGKLIGSARDFATQRDRYTILDGDHTLRIEYPGYRTFESDLEIVPNKTLHLDIQLDSLDQE
jgi:hypothetical protein